jgi:hypothetical protein
VHVHQHVREPPHRYRHTLRRSRGARREDHDERRIGSDDGRYDAVARIRLGKLIERHIACAATVAARDDAPRRIRWNVFGRIEFRALIGIDDHHLRGASLQPHGNSRRGERGEQRHMHRAQAPNSK